MPARLTAPVLTVDAGLIHKLDTRNPENLFSMWTVLSRCSGSIDGGPRYENLSWRLWSREVFCCDPKSETAVATSPISTSARSSEAQSPNEVPSLSGSVDSLVYQEEAIDFESDSSDVTCAPIEMHTSRTDSISSRVSRGRERHITPQDLEKMVFTIKEKKDLEPLPPTIDTSVAVLVPLAEDSKTPKIVTELTSKPSTPIECSITSNCASENSHATSDGASGVSERSTTSIVRGFSPSHVSSSFRTIPLVTAPSSEEAALAKTKKHAMFALGGSSGEDSLSEHTDAIQQNLQLKPTKKKTAMFSFGGSSNEEESSLPHNMANGVPNALMRSPVVRKQTSFREELASRTIQEESSALSDDVFETDDEDEIDESAIDDDDDSSDWEDSVEDSGNPSIDEKTFFQRVDSRPALTSRRSLITTMLHQNDRASALAQAAANTSRSTPALLRSRTTSPNGPSLAASPDSDDASPLMMKRNSPGLKPIAEIPRSSAQPILAVPTTGPLQLALSPRTTRRKMINDELTVSLRQHLVHEHRQKSQTANAVLQRRHTTQDVANLKQYPEKVHMNNKDGDALNNSWNQYFGQGLGEYHSKGW
ncbi:hypothetical protein HYFRA_00003924 [Hymenoscyphus fraxineus]|uniref:Nitrogen regulatory protein areA GATA-like domain-containing protein n=1 Tax=Hymenoscyphus fraxineus TaxID=746836 RepID=A0A9N9L0S0_9HELO|nr:hypothetical protein HYFRA_00003924 [Hymenoscyphus fraxineus]